MQRVRKRDQQEGATFPKFFLCKTLSNNVILKTICLFLVEREFGEKHQKRLLNVQFRLSSVAYEGKELFGNTSSF